MIKSYTNGEWKEPGSLCQAVGIYKEDFHKIVSVVGGGGKTTVIRAMLRECMENSDGRIPCAVSTTTHIQKTNAEYFLGEPSMKMFRKKLSDYEAVWMGREIRKGKLASFQKEFLEEMISPKLYTMFVTPKDVDEIVENLSTTIAHGLNKYCRELFN